MHVNINTTITIKHLHCRNDIEVRAASVPVPAPATRLAARSKRHPRRYIYSHGIDDLNLDSLFLARILWSALLLDFVSPPSALALIQVIAPLPSSHSTFIPRR